MAETMEPTTSGHAVGKLMKYMRMAQQGWLVLAAWVVIFLTPALVYSFLSTPLYEASARLMVVQQGTGPFSLPNVNQVTTLESTDEFLPTQVAILRSHVVVMGAIDSVGLDNLPTLRAAREREKDPAQVAIDLYLRISRPERSAKVLQIDFKALSREEATRMTGAIVVSYRKFLEENYRRHSEVIALIAQARQELSTDLDDAEKKYAAFRQKYPALSTDEKGRSLLMGRLERWDRALTEAQVRETQLKAQHEMVQKLAKEGTGLWAMVHAMNQVGTDAGSSGTSLLNFTTNAAQSTSWDYIRQLTNEQQQLAERFGPNYSKVQDIQEQITRIQERIRSSRSKYEQGEITDLLTALDQALLANAAMRMSLAKGFEQDKQAESDFMTEANLRSNLERRRALWNAVVDQLKQAQLTSGFSNIATETLKPPTPWPDPVRPRWVLIPTLAVFLGLLFGCATLLVKDYLKETSRQIGAKITCG